MARLFGILFMVLVSSWAAAVSDGLAAPPDSDVRNIHLTRVVQIPLKPIVPEQPEAAQKIDPTVLLVSPGAEDELPEGPDGLDVLEDGSFLISDPLRDRIAVFDSQGKFRESWSLDFAPDSVTAVGKELVVVRDAATGHLHAFGTDGRPRSMPDNALPKPAAARLESKSRAVVERSANGGLPGPLEIQFDKPGMILLSVESLGTDGEGNSYVALEATGGSAADDEINMDKYVWKYSASGRLIGEVSQIPLDYYIPPINELRVRNGVVYQLTTTKAEVRINVWDTK